MNEDKQTGTPEAWGLMIDPLSRPNSIPDATVLTREEATAADIARRDLGADETKEIRDEQNARW